MKKKDVLSLFKSTSKVAQLLGISRVAVWKWGEIIPEKNAYRLQEITKGKLKVNGDLYRNKHYIKPKNKK